MNTLLNQTVEVKINNNVVLSGTIVYVETHNEEEHEVVVEENGSKRQYIVQFPISSQL